MRKIFVIVIVAVVMAGCASRTPPAVVAPGPDGGGQANTSPAWAGLGLKGALVLITPGQNGTTLQRLDLASGAMKLIYQAADRALISTALVSPDGAQILLAYAPPPTEQTQLVYTSLYLLPADGKGSPQPVFKSVGGDEAFFAPVWAPDGKSIYTSHFHRGSDTVPDRFTIDQVALDGTSKQVLADGQWPSISPDGKLMAYVSAAPNGPNALYLAGIDGSSPHPALPVGTFQAVDDHFFTPDGKGIVFSAVNPFGALPTPSLFDRIFGIDVVSAHNVPSDWYMITLATGKIQRLTTLGDTGMYATLSPDRQRVAFIAQSGIYVMNLDGSHLTQLSDQVATGTVDWRN